MNIIKYFKLSKKTKLFWIKYKYAIISIIFFIIIIICCNFFQFNNESYVTNNILSNSPIDMYPITFTSVKNSNLVKIPFYNNISFSTERNISQLSSFRKPFLHFT